MTTIKQNTLNDGLYGNKKFKNKQELWQWLIDGNEIIENFQNSNRRIKLFNGNPVYENGKEAKNCLFSHDYWIKYI